MVGRDLPPTSSWVPHKAASFEDRTPLVYDIAKALHESLGTQGTIECASVLSQVEEGR